MKSKLRRLLKTKRAWVVVNALLVVVILAGLGGIVWFGGKWLFSDDQVGSQQDDPVDAAREVVTKILTVSPKSVDSDLGAVEEMADGDFLEEWMKGKASVKQSVQESGASREGEVLKAAFLKGDSDSASVILAADTTTTFKNKIEDSKGKKKDDKKKQAGDKDGDGVPDPRTDHFRIKADMALVDDAWKIVGMEMTQ